MANHFSIKGIKIDVDGKYSRTCNYKIDKEIVSFVNWASTYARENEFDVEIFSFAKQMFSQ